MGVDAVLIVENSRRVSLEQFLNEWEKKYLLIFPESFDVTSWIEFEWEGKWFFFFDIRYAPVQVSDFPSL